MLEMYTPSLNRCWMMILFAAQPFARCLTERRNLVGCNILTHGDPNASRGLMTLSRLLGREFDPVSRSAESLGSVVQKPRTPAVSGVDAPVSMLSPNCHGRLYPLQ